MVDINRVKVRFIHQNPHWQSYQWSSLVVIGRIWVKEMVDFVYEIFLSYSQRYLICLKLLQHGTSSSVSPSKEGVLQIFITLKNPLPRLDLNPQTLGPVASILTITPLKRSHCLLLLKVFEFHLHKYNYTNFRPAFTSRIK
jgi:hypothetical protein